MCVFLFISSFSLLDVSKSAFQPPSMHVSSCPFAHRRSFFFIINFAVFTSVGHLLDFSYLNYATETIDFESAVYMGADLIRSGIYTC